MTNVTRATFDQVMVPNYAPAAMLPVRGEGARVWDVEGRELLDLVQLEAAAAGMGRLARFAGAGPGGALGGDAAGKAEPVHLADHRVAGDAMAKPAGDLAGAQPFRPELLEKLHAFVGPGQFCPPMVVVQMCTHGNPSYVAGSWTRRFAPFDDQDLLHLVAQ